MNTNFVDSEGSPKKKVSPRALLANPSMGRMCFVDTSTFHTEKKEEIKTHDAKPAVSQSTVVEKFCLDFDDMPQPRNEAVPLNHDVEPQPSRSAPFNISSIEASDNNWLEEDWDSDEDIGGNNSNNSNNYVQELQLRTSESPHHMLTVGSSRSDVSTSLVRSLESPSKLRLSTEMGERSNISAKVFAKSAIDNLGDRFNQSASIAAGLTLGEVADKDWLNDDWDSDE